MLVCLDETVRLTKRPDLGGFIWSDRLGGFMHGIGLFHGPTVCSHSKSVGLLEEQALVPANAAASVGHVGDAAACPQGPPRASLRP